MAIITQRYSSWIPATSKTSSKPVYHFDISFWKRTLRVISGEFQEKKAMFVDVWTGTEVQRILFFVRPSKYSQVYDHSNAIADASPEVLKEVKEWLDSQSFADLYRKDLHFLLLDLKKQYPYNLIYAITDECPWFELYFIKSLEIHNNFYICIW